MGDENPSTYDLRFPSSESKAAMALARNVHQLRGAAGLSQTELATMTGIRQPELSKIESARGNPSLTFIEKIAEALDVSVYRLFAPSPKSKARKSKVRKSKARKSRS